jgi:hypothetical protein
MSWRSLLGEIAKPGRQMGDASVLQFAAFGDFRA